MMTAKQAEQLVEKAIGDDWTVTGVYDDPHERIVVAPADSDMYSQSVFGLRELLALGDAFETDKISVNYESGWCGTDVTPGDPSSLTIEIVDPGSREKART